MTPAVMGEDLNRKVTGGSRKRKAVSNSKVIDLYGSDEDDDNETAPGAELTLRGKCQTTVIAFYLEGAGNHV